MATIKASGLPVTVRVTIGSDILDLEDWEFFLVLRRKHGLRQEDVAAAAGTNQPWLSKWERGRVTADEEQLNDLWSALFRLVREKPGVAA